MQAHAIKEIILIIIRRLPDVHKLAAIDFSQQGSSNYVTFHYLGRNYTVNQYLEVEAGYCETDAMTRNIQAVLRGERDTLQDYQQELANVIDSLVLGATSEELFELMVGIGEPEEGTHQELQKAFREFLNSRTRSREDKIEYVGIFFGHEKQEALRDAFHNA